MKCQTLLFVKNKKNTISLSCAELAKRLVKVKVLLTTAADDILIFLNEKIRLGILCESSAGQMNHLLGR